MKRGRGTALPARVPPESGRDGLDLWYLAEAKRGQRLLDGGQVGQATEVFESLLTRFGDAPSYGKAVILGRLGRCAHLGGRPDEAAAQLREAIVVAGQLAPSAAVKRLHGTLHSELGDAFRASGRCGEARRAYATALEIAETLKDLRSQGVDIAQLGALALVEGDLEEAETRYRRALLIFRQLHEPALEAAARHQLGRIFQEKRQCDEAERHYRLAIDLDRSVGNPVQLARHLSNLADFLQHQPGRVVEARQLAEEAVTSAQARDPAAAEVWKHYGVLAEIADTEAAAAADSEQKAALEVQACRYRQLRQQAPLVVATLARLGGQPSYGRAVILARLGRCFLIGGRPDLAVAQIREALGVAEQLAPGDGGNGLRGMLHAELGDALRALGQDGDARKEYVAAQQLADAVCERGAVAAESSGGLPPGFEVTLHEDVITDYVFEPDLLLDGRRERRSSRWTGAPDALADDVRLMLVPCARTYMDEGGAVRFSLPVGEPILERHPDCIVMRRARREVAVTGNPGVLWRLIRGMDGASTVAKILSELPAGERAAAARILAVLAATGTIDASGRPIGRFLHWATKKGVLPAGGLESDDVLRLATDGHYRAYPAAPRIALGQSIPERLRAFHALTRSRRSRRDFRGLALRRDDFDALLFTACGVTGAMPWAGREAKLRAYPSSGALYAVEIYPVVFRVEGLEAAVYHYRAVENVLEVVRPCIDRARIVAAALPVEREMVAGAAAMVCLVGFFSRHERKYGEGGYRMMVAEAGHIAQNLILAATALGLSARPFGGVFDDLLNHDLGLNGAEEQFLLAVLVGYIGGEQGGNDGW